MKLFLEGFKCNEVTFRHFMFFQEHSKLFLGIKIDKNNKALFFPRFMSLSLWGRHIWVPLMTNRQGSLGATYVPLYKSLSSESWVLNLDQMKSEFLEWRDKIQFTYIKCDSCTFCTGFCMKGTSREGKGKLWEGVLITYVNAYWFCLSSVQKVPSIKLYSNNDGLSRLTSQGRTFRE